MAKKASLKPLTKAKKPKKLKGGDSGLLTKKTITVIKQNKL